MIKNPNFSPIPLSLLREIEVRIRDYLDANSHREFVPEYEIASLHRRLKDSQVLALVLERLGLTQTSPIQRTPPIQPTPPGG